MTLWDQKPITEEEIAARILCTCQHTYWCHFNGTSWLAAAGEAEERKGACSKCDCEEFEEVRS